MSTKKKLKRAHERMQMEAMEPRLLLSADLLALAGLPDVDHGDEDAPWDQFSSDPSELFGGNSANDTPLPSPLELSLFETDSDRSVDSDRESGNLLTLLNGSDQAATTSQLLFVDTRVPDYTDLIDLIRQAHPDEELQVYLIDAAQDGVNQITDALANHTAIDALHVISHGSAEGLQLGSTWLSSGNVNAFADQFGAWSGSLTQDADLLLYGCDLAVVGEGKALVDAIAALTGADVAASTDLTGQTALGGDWELEYHAGLIESTAFSTDSLQQWSGLLGTIESYGAGSARATAADGSGNYVVVWSESDTDGDGWGVFAQRYNNAGVAQGGEIQVNQTSADDQRWASVGMDAAGAFTVSWSSSNQDGTASSIYARQFNADGSAAGSEFRVNTTNSGAQTNASIDVDAAGKFIVVWQGKGAADANGVFYRRFDADGAAVDASEVIAHSATDGTTSEHDPGVAWLTGGKFVVTWDEGQHAYFTRFDADGAALDPARVAVDAGSFLAVTSGLSVDANASGTFAIAYKHEGIGSSIYARAFNEDGSNAFTNSDVLLNWTYVAGSSALNPSVAIDDSGKVVVSYQSTAAGGDIYALLINADGSKSASATAVVTDAGDQNMPSAAPLGGGNFAFAWNDIASGNTATLVFDAINDAPVLGDNTPTLSNINVNSFNSAGNSVAAIVVDGSITDPDGAAVESIAIIAADNSNGSWQYSTDNGSSWNSVDDGSLAANHALLLDGTLGGGTTQKLRFVPDANFSGSASFTFRAWDQSSGSAGSYANTSVNGGTSAFSTATDTASIAVIPSDSDGDGLWDHYEDANTDSDYNPATNAGPDTDGDSTPNWLDADDDGDGNPTSAENADPNGDGDPRDALDSDHDGQPDWLDAALTTATNGTVDTTSKLSAATAASLTAALENGDRFGSGVAAIGDLDGDGVVDVAVGADNDDDGDNNRGAVYILFMNADGSIKATQKISDTAGGLTANLDDDDNFGRALAGIGDIDGDGIGDIAVGANYDDDGGKDRGAVYILFLNSDGTVKAEQKISSTNGGVSGSLSNNDRFGRAVAGIGDLDGDGINDIAVGAETDDDGGTNHGAVYVLFLNADGTVKAQQKISDTAGGLAAALDNGDLFGVSVAGIGDLDGDGSNDIAVGALYDDDGGSDRGAVYILFLNPDGTVKAEQKISDLSGGLAAALDNDDAFGVSVAAIGDADGDGTPDLLVGADADDDGGSDRGAVYVLFLNADGTVKAQQKISSNSGGLSATLDDGWFGVSAASLGDLNGDGILDLLVGAEKDDDGGSDRGAVYVLNLKAVSSNSAPALATATAPALSAIDEDDATPAGDSVAAIVVDGSISDADGAAESIAIIAVDNSNGTWQYSTDNGSSWNNVDDGSLDTDHALLLDGTLAGASTQKLRFVPAADFNGSASFTFRAWDQSSGSAGSYADTSVNGGTTAFSSATDNATITVNPVNDAPTLSGGPYDLGSTIAFTTSSGVQVTSILAGLTSGDDDGDTLGIAITALSGNNLWQYSADSSDGLDGSWQGVGAVASNSALLLDQNSWLRYVPDGSNAETPTITFHAWDQSSGSASSGTPSYADSGSGSAFSSGSAQAQLTVTPSNNPPTGGVTIDNSAPTQGQTLTAANTLADAEGFSSAIGYQWLRDGVAISGATAGSYTTVQADVGKAISVTASYTDGLGNDESSTSAGTAAVLNANDAGTVTIDDTTPSQGQTLTASVSDLDGAGGPISYQWFRDGAPIAGATSISYTTLQADVGRAISVSASYTDDLGGVETPLSTATANVANINDAGSIVIDDTTPTQGQTLTAILTDPDGATGVINYQWYSDGAAISGATGSSYTLVQDDVTKVISVSASYTDDLGSAETPLSAETSAVANVNEAGSISIDDTTPTQGQTLTASVSDGDGASGAIGYQWYRDGSPISGATSSSYTAAQADVGKTISVSASYTDDLGGAETPLSGATSAVVNINDPGSLTIDDTTPEQNQTLTASLSDIDGASGAISYQWYRDGSPISGATASSYTTVQADVGKAISVSAGYTDDLAAVENPVSAATAAVAEVNDAPTFSQFYDALGTTDEDTEVEITLATMLAVGDESDIDGSVDGFLVTSISSGTLKIGADAASATAWNLATNAVIDAANKGYWTPAAHANGILDAFAAAAIDDAGVVSSGSATGQVIVAAVNDVPTGLPVIGGAAAEHATLTADTAAIGDADGLGAFSYQWLRDGAAVNGATGTSYTLDDIDVGSRMSVRVSYTDGDGTTETLTSAQTAVVTAVNDAPAVLRNQLTLSQGESVILSSAMLAATDEDNAAGSLLFTLTSVNGGRFELVSNPGVAVTSFNQAQISAGQVRFVDDGDNRAPSFMLEVSDSQVSVASAAAISFTPKPVLTIADTAVPTTGDSTTLPEAIATDDPAVAVVITAPEILAAADDAEDEVSVEKDAAVKADAAVKEEQAAASAGAEPPFESTADDAPEATEKASDNPGSQSESAAESGSGLHSIINHNALRSPFVNLLLGAVAAPELPAVPKLLASEIHTVLTASGFLGDLDRIRGTTNEASNMEQQRVASTIAVSTGLSVGYVAWLIRSGVLLSTALSSLPAWHFVDPLPVLGTIAANQAKGKETDDEEDSVESMFKDQAAAADMMESGKEAQVNTNMNNSDLPEHSQL